MKQILISTCLMLTSCNNAFYKHYQPYIEVGQDIEYLKKRLKIDYELNHITKSQSEYYIEMLDTLKFNIYTVSYNQKMPLLMPFYGRKLENEAKSNIKWKIYLKNVDVYHIEDM